MDQFARDIAIAGLLVAILSFLVAGSSLSLQYVRHRQEQPSLRLTVERVEPELSRGDHWWDITFKLSNEGGTPTTVSEVRNATTTDNVVYTVAPVTSPMRGAKLDVHGLKEWQVRWNAFAADERDAEFVVTVEAVGAEPASARFSLKTHRLSEDFSRKLGLIDEDLDTT